ncbi:M1 family metallopeptidase [Ferruginibacter lapsinanis]|uniref:M1 family metallopeptidase n=1 Tax=Ferruginibacter lapsinanis TaxID=563172 RepID=UPI001E5D864B|nr:M1 family metallopeptidase [Ferruginibacter lapsinanis]UEG49357.1 M1 family metallopeptidase [Ferruginibacter lapsinanis]
MKHLVSVLLVFHFSFFIFHYSIAQSFTHADTLRGSVGTGRDWWDVLRYDVNVKFDFEDSTISGYANIEFKIIRKGIVMQIDLQEPLVLDSVFYIRNDTLNNGLLNKGILTAASKIEKITRDGNTYFFNNIAEKKSKRTHKLVIYYHGKPQIAIYPPWDGGLIWKRDKNNNPWISVACQGLGASVWYPCKDHQSDEPDKGASLTMTFPDTLVAVANGRLKESVDNNDNTKTVTWEVKSPINNYDLAFYIGKYVHFGETYKGVKGNLTMDYWVLDYDLEKAKKQFTDAKRMMKAFEYWFGPYPFYEDGYKLIEAPHLGMEHQSGIAYGNKYQNGYLGNDLSHSGWGLKWDFIIVHESGHEWFGNNITTKDIADMWVHESFTNYSETLFTEFYYGKKAADAYLQGTRENIENKNPVISSYGVNKESETTDMYYKGANMIHTIRQVINNDALFRKILQGLNKTFYYQTVTTRQIEEYIIKQSKINFSKVFDQYLRTIQIPVLEYKIEGYKISYRYTNCIKGFILPLKINAKGQRWIRPTEQWQTLSLYPEGEINFSVDPNFYINTKKVE